MEWQGSGARWWEMPIFKGEWSSSSNAGPSLALDWMYNCHEGLSVDHYELRRRRANMDKTGDTNGHAPIMPLSGDERQALIQWHTDCTDKEIQKNIRECDKVRRQREASIRGQRYEGYLLAFEKYQRRIKINKRN